MTMKRRDALKTIGGLAGAAGMAKVLPACGGNDDGPVGITTFVYLMMENRTFDHALGARALEGLGGDGLALTMSNPDLDGNPVNVFEADDDHDVATSAVCDPDPPHGRAASIAQFNNGANDGFLREYQSGEGRTTANTQVMKYLTRKNLPVTWALADQYTICDRWFASVIGPTLPNRAYWHTGTCLGIDNNKGVLDAFSAGIPVPSIYNRLDEAGVDWCYYAGNVAVASLLGQPGPFQLDLGPNDGTGRVRRFGDAKQMGGGDFFGDAKAGRLPQVVYIDPAFGVNDDHPPAHPILGQELIAAVYTALATSPQWKNILFVITYDEHGGYFDHVPPPTTVDDTLEKFGVDGFQQMGFRVPAMVIGPYAKQGVVSTVFDHTSALKHLQNHFGLGSLNVRVDAANDLSDCIDQERLAAGEPAAPIALPTFDSDEWPFGGPDCVGVGFKRADDPITAWADDNPGAFGPYDFRDRTEDYLEHIRNYLQFHGLRR